MNAGIDGTDWICGAAWVTEQARFNGRIFHHTPRALRPLRDFVFDHTSFLQKVIGDQTPRHILKQLEEITG